MEAEKWEFANEAFLRGQKHQVKHIRRRKASVPQAVPSQQAVEVDSLRRDKQVLVMEVVKLRQQQQTSRDYLQQMELRLQSTEKKQQQMMSFLGRAMQNPEFIHHKEKRKELEEAMSKKRRRPIEAAESSSVKVEAVEFGELYGFQVSELEALALEMQGFGRSKWEELDMGSYDKELDDGFWEELLNEGFHEESGMNRDGEGGEGEDFNVLADRLGFLGSTPN